MTEHTQPEQPQKPAAPSRPQYGEMAPEGWVSPVTGAPVAGDSVAPETSKATAARSLDGVPHNLGVNTHAPAKAPAKAPSAEPQPAANVDGSAPVTPAQTPATPSQATKPTAARDRVATIVLLAFGAFGALNLADAFMQLPQSAAQLYALYDLGSFTAPEWLSTVSTVGWIAMLAIWAISLILSIQLMQRGKLSFYVPLSAAALAFIVMSVIMAIVVMNAMPELVTYVQTNGLNLEKLQELQ